MKESVIEVLMYLFENYIYDEPDVNPDREELSDQLQEAGFSQREIGRAFEWLDGLAERRDMPEMASVSDYPVRIYTDHEQQRMDVDCRGFLTYLEHAGVLDGTRRELVIERVMALESEEVDLEDLKWIILMVLFTQPGQEANYAWMENHLFDYDEESTH